MAIVRFNRTFTDLELNRRVKAGEKVEMTLKRADELVDTISKKAPEFNYERLDKPKASKESEKEKESEEEEE